MWAPSEDPLHPLNTMVRVDGVHRIPISVSAVVAFGFVLSAFIINVNPWRTSEHGAWEIPYKALSESSIGRPSLLLLFRLYTTLHLCYVTFGLWSYRGAVMLFFYTNWTFVLETFYFIAATAVSIRSFMRKPRGRLDLAGLAVVATFHVALVACLVVDILHWGVLWPLLRNTPDPVVRAHHTAMTFSWSSYNTHGLNLVFILVELLLNNIPYQPYLVGFTGYFTGLYALWAFTVHVNTGRWIYPFLNTSKPWAFFVYAGILVGHLIFFGFATVLFRLKDKIMGTELATDDAIASLLDDAEDDAEDKKAQ